MYVGLAKAWEETEEHQTVQARLGAETGWSRVQD